jgi:methionine-rich copper-binding protein CopC
LRRLLSRIPRSILAMRARTDVRCRPHSDLRRRSGVLSPGRRQGRAPPPSGHCDDQCPRCRSGSGGHRAEVSRSDGAGRRQLPHARSRARTGAPSLEFSEGVEPRFLCRSDKRRSGAGKQEVLVTPIAKSFSPGVYTVHWRAVSVGSHHTQGTFQFTVQ